MYLRVHTFDEGEVFHPHNLVYSNTEMRIKIHDMGTFWQEV